MRAIKLAPTPLSFLSPAERKRFGPEIEGALAEYADTATALVELLGPLQQSGSVPRAVATLNARRLERLGYSHEMIVAGAMITLLNQPKDAWVYLEQGVLARWRGTAGGHRPEKLYTHAAVVEELNRRGEGTRLDDIFEQAGRRDGSGKPMWRKR